MPRCMNISYLFHKNKSEIRPQKKIQTKRKILSLLPLYFSITLRFSLLLFLSFLSLPSSPLFLLLWRLFIAKILKSFHVAIQGGMDQQREKPAGAWVGDGTTRGAAACRGQHGQGSRLADSKGDGKNKLFTNW